MGSKKKGAAKMSDAREAAGKDDDVDVTVTYVYDPYRYFVDVTLPNWVSVACLVLSAVLFAAGVVRWLCLIVIVVCGYSTVNAFVDHAYPREVTLGDGEISFVSSGARETYRLDELKRVHVRTVPQSSRIYVRMNDSGPLRGRYFVACSDMHDDEGNDATPVRELLLDEEERLSPEDPRVRARTRNK